MIESFTRLNKTILYSNSLPLKRLRRFLCRIHKIRRDRIYFASDVSSRAREREEQSGIYEITFVYSLLWPLVLIPDFGLLLMMIASKEMQTDNQTFLYMQFYLSYHSCSITLPTSPFHFHVNRVMAHQDTHIGSKDCTKRMTGTHRVVRNSSLSLVKREPQDK